MDTKFHKFYSLLKSQLDPDHADYVVLARPDLCHESSKISKRLWKDECLVWNGMMDSTQPSIIVRARSLRDCQVGGHSEIIKC